MTQFTQLLEVSFRPLCIVNDEFVKLHFKYLNLWPSPSIKYFLKYTPAFFDRPTGACSCTPGFNGGSWQYLCICFFLGGLGGTSLSSLSDDGPYRRRRCASISTLATLNLFFIALGFKLSCKNACTLMCNVATFNLYAAFHIHLKSWHLVVISYYIRQTDNLSQLLSTADTSSSTLRNHWPPQRATLSCTDVYADITGISWLSDFSEWLGRHTTILVVML